MTTDLSWGHGPHLFEAFLEPTCPFSVRAFGKLWPMLDQAGEERLTIRIWLQSQPWHMLSGVLVRAILAAERAGGKDAARQVMQAIAERREGFEFEDHARGPNLDRTPRQVVDELEQITGISIWPEFDRKDLQAEIKRHVKYGRQNGIHVSPTFMADGLVTGLGSGDEIGMWLKAVELG